MDLSDELALVRATREPVAHPVRSDEADEPTVAVPRLLRPVADLPPQLGGDGYSEDSVAGLPRAERRHRGAGDRSGRPAGSRPWWSTTRSSPASRTTPSRRPSRRTDPGAPARARPPAEVPGTDEPPAEIELPTVPGTVPEIEPELPGTTPRSPDATVNLADRMDEAEEFETESIQDAAGRRPARQAGHGAQLGRDHVRRAQALTLTRWRPVGRGSRIQSLHEPG